MPKVKTNLRPISERRVEGILNFKEHWLYAEFCYRVFCDLGKSLALFVLVFPSVKLWSLYLTLPFLKGDVMRMNKVMHCGKMC
jgi:hypothetical protein